MTDWTTMRRLWNTFLKGLAAVLPVALTIYVVFWLAKTAESVLGGPVQALLPKDRYWPGLGLLAAFVFILIVGLLVEAYIVRRLFRFGESILARIPLVKTIFGAVKDFSGFLPGNEGRDPKRVVLWRLGGAQLIGFVTEEQVNPKLFGPGSDDLVAVYFPMSYQIGGYTLYLQKDELRETQLSVEEAMRLVLIGGVSSHHPSHQASSAATSPAATSPR